MGQLFKYFMAPREDVYQKVRDRFALVYPNLNTDSVSIGVHLRGGKPDVGRKPLQLDEMMTQIDDTVARLAKANQTVSQVYICSDEQDTNIISAEHMSKLYPRKFRYAILPHLNYSMGTEAEWAFADKKKNLSPADVYAEFLADIHILAHADVFIGSRSNIYIVVAALRAASYPDRPLENCGYLDSLSSPPKYVGETHQGAACFHEFDGWDNDSSFW
jgi:hypothetical protein